MPSFRRIRPRSGPFVGQRVRCYCLCTHDELIPWHVAKGRGARIVSHKIVCPVCEQMVWTFAEKKESER